MSDSAPASPEGSSSNAGKFSKIVSALGKKMQGRADPAELIQKNILKEEELSSPSFAQSKADLEKAKTQDLLNKRLSHRPDKVDLKLRNILRVESSESLDQSGLTLDKSLDFEKRSNTLKSCLKQRPDKVNLEGLNIIKCGGGVDSSIVTAQQQLKRAQIENSLESKLRDRPAPEDVDKLLNFSEVVEVLPTFRKSEYNRKPDTNATFKKLTPQMKTQIREELNSFKKSEMPVHELSKLFVLTRARF